MYIFSEISPSENNGTCLQADKHRLGLHVLHGTSNGFAKIVQRLWLPLASSSGGGGGTPFAIHKN